MLRSVYGKSVRDQRRSLAWWSLGVALLVALTIAVWPAVRDAPQLDELVADLPPPLRAAFGADDLTSPAGYLASRLFALLVPVLFAVYGIGRGAAAIAGEEERGGLELLLAHPLSRRRIALARLAAALSGLLVLATVLLVTLLAGVAAVGMDIRASEVARAVLGAVLLTATFTTLAFAVGCATGRRGVTLGVAAAVAVASYLLDATARAVQSVRPLRWVSPFWYALGEQPVTAGLDAAGAAVLVTTAAVLTLLGVARFGRRDVAV